MKGNIEAFNKYASQFDLSIKMIKYKYNHSFRVQKQAEEICKSLKLNNDDTYLASNIALLHDIARFRQWEKYKTFKDRDSFDHGDEGCKILFEEKEIENYDIDKKDYEIVKNAIYYHNKYKIDLDKLNEREILHSKIVRDADKIDILYAFSTNRILELKEDDEKINPVITKDFFNHKEILNSDVKTKNDKIISMFAQCFDFNYLYSKKRVYVKNYIGKMFSHLKNKELFKPYVDETIKYLEGEIKNAR